MVSLRTAPLGAACLLYAALLGAAPSSELTPTTAPPLDAVAGAPWRTAMRAVWSASPEVQAARARLEAARARARAAARPLYNPALTLDAEDADVDRRTAGLSLALDLSGKRRARSAQGEAELRAEEAAYDLARRNVAARWLKAWSTAALTARQRELGQRRVMLMQRFDELAAQRLKVGDISSPERDLAALALGEAQAQQAALVGSEAAARAALVALAGDARIAVPPLPAGLPPSSAQVTPREIDALPEVLEAEAQLASAEASTQVARRARIPDPTLSLTSGRVRSGPLSDRVIGLSVSVPLPVLNTGAAEVDAARAQADAAAADVRSQRLRARAALQEADARYGAMRASIKTFRSGRAAAFDERAALLEKLWRAGEIGTSDYLVQIKQSLDTALSGLELESHGWQAWFDYLTAAGRLTDWIDGRAQDDHR